MVHFKFSFYFKTYGLFCKDKWVTIYVAPLQICDGVKNCQRGEDERNCRITNETAAVCESAWTENKIVPILDNVRCAPFEALIYYHLDVQLKSYCSNFHDLWLTCLGCSVRNCTLHLGYPSTISIFVVCSQELGRDVSLCDDGVDTECVSPTVQCHIHKHQLCDGVIDCTDEQGSDESDAICSLMTSDTCWRQYIHSEPLQIPVSWIGDNVKDCISGIDEQTDLWPLCGTGNYKYFAANSSDCDRVYKCNNWKDFLQLSMMCDGVLSPACGEESALCEATSGRESVPQVIPSSVGSSTVNKVIMYCVKGLHLFDSTCSETKFTLPISDKTLGYNKSTSLSVPLHKVSCSYLFGEYYVFLSCLGLCEGTVSCAITKKIKHDSCGGQYRNRVFTLADNSYLTFLVPSRGTLSNDLFLCDNGRCIDYQRVCNLANDCGDGSDERSCSNNFHCKDKSKILSLDRICNGVVDCKDGSDECNNQCRETLAKSVALRVSAFGLGIAATLLNLWATKKLVYKCFVKTSKTLSAFLNQGLLLIIALSDLMIGFYLIALGALDVLHKDTYCKMKDTWLSSKWCGILGVGSTIASQSASQSSLFAMTVISIVRANSIVRGLRIEPELTPKLRVRGLAVVAAIYFLGTGISVLPMIPYLEEFFVNGLTVERSLNLFLGSTSKETSLSTLRVYYGRLQATLPWTEIRELIRAMFTEGDEISIRKRHFIPLLPHTDKFKYQLRNDPQKGYVGFVLGLNATCFAIISLAYILVGVTTNRSSKGVMGNGNENMAVRMRKRNQALQTKIAMIIGTDFACWSPFIIVSILNACEVVDLSAWYGFLSIVFLPINGIINPLLYSSLSGPAYAVIKKAVTSVNESVRQLVIGTIRRCRVRVLGWLVLRPL
eukprot:sb/3461907/